MFLSMTIKPTQSIESTARLRVMMNKSWLSSILVVWRYGIMRYIYLLGPTLPIWKVLTWWIIYLERMLKSFTFKTLLISTWKFVSYTNFYWYAPQLFNGQGWDHDDKGGGRREEVVGGIQVAGTATAWSSSGGTEDRDTRLPGSWRALTSHPRAKSHPTRNQGPDDARIWRRTRGGRGRDTEARRDPRRVNTQG